MTKVDSKIALPIKAAIQIQESIKFLTRPNFTKEWIITNDLGYKHRLHNDIRAAAILEDEILINKILKTAK